jgi:hypothetical protein
MQKIINFAAIISKKANIIRKIILLMSALTIWLASLSAQITQQQADAIVSEYVKAHIAEPYLLYAHLETQGEEV